MAKQEQEVVITVDKVSKDFILPHAKASSVKSLFTGAYRKGGRTRDERQHALRDISLEIREGEFFGIVGRNGSGKSTMLKILAQIYQPTKGCVTTRGKLVPFIELGVGFNPELTGRENVYLNGAMLGFSRKEIDHMYDDIVAFAELGRFMDQKLKNYSSGMQVRLAFSMATRSKADILLIDEVLAVGDADFQRKCFDYFRELKRNHKTVVFVSHDMDAVREYCDRAALIDKSHVVDIGTAEAIAKRYIKLFMPVNDQVDDTPATANDKKWGAGGVDITLIKTDKQHYSEQDKELAFTVEVAAQRDFPDGLIHGFSIKNDAGHVICGTNNRILKVKTAPIAKGKKITVQWAVPNIFNEGNYTIEPAVSNGTDMNLCQWWDNAKTVRFTNEQKTPYLAAPPVTVTIS